MCWFVILFLWKILSAAINSRRFSFFFFSKDLQNILFESGQYIIGSILFFLLEFESYETKALECIFQHMYLKKDWGAAALLSRRGLLLGSCTDV